MIQRSLILGIAVVCFLTASTPRAEAAPNLNATLAAHLDHNAAFAARVDAVDWEQLVEQYKGSGIPGASTTVFTISAAATALLGFDPLVQTGWYEAGIDGGAPMLVSLARFKQAWRLRIVLAVDDRAKLDKTFSRIARAIPGLHEVNKRNARAIAKRLGQPGFAALAAEMRKHNVRGAGVLPMMGLAVALHRKGDVAIIDILGPHHQAGAQTSPAVSTGATAKPSRPPSLMDAVRSTPKGLGARLAKGAARALTRPGMTLWADGTNAYDELLRLESLHGVVGNLSQPMPAPARPAVCGSFREIPTAGPFLDVAITARLRTMPNHRNRTKVSLSVNWGLRGPYKLAQAVLLHDDMISQATSHLSRGASIAGQTFLRTLAPLRSLARPAALRGSRRELRRNLLTCGSTALATTWVLGWPQLLGHFLDRLAKVHPQAQAVVEGTRNTAFAVFHASLDPSKISAFAEASVDPKVVPFVETYFGLLFGPRTRKTAARGWTEWGTGPIRPYRWDTADKTPVFGAGLQSAAVKRRMLKPKNPMLSTKRLVAELVIKPRVLFKQLRTTVPWLDLFRAGVGRMGIMTSRLQFSRGSLQAITDFNIH